jgi:hypothetical protein
MDYDFLRVLTLDGCDVSAFLQPAAMVSQGFKRHSHFISFLDILPVENDSRCPVSGVDHVDKQPQGFAHGLTVFGIFTQASLEHYPLFLSHTDRPHLQSEDGNIEYSGENIGVNVGMLMPASSLSELR